MKQRFILYNTATEEYGTDEFLTRIERNQRNQTLLKGGSPWRWVPCDDMPEAA